MIRPILFIVLLFTVIFTFLSTDAKKVVYNFLKRNWFTLTASVTLTTFFVLYLTNVF